MISRLHCWAFNNREGIIGVSCLILIAVFAIWFCYLIDTKNNTKLTKQQQEGTVLLRRGFEHHETVYKIPVPEGYIIHGDRWGVFVPAKGVEDGE